MAFVKPITDFSLSVPSSLGDFHQNVSKIHHPSAVHPKDFKFPSVKTQTIQKPKPQHGPETPNLADYKTQLSLLLHKCENVILLKEIHAHIYRKGLKGNLALESKLVKLYARNGSMESARQLFDKMPQPNIELWNVMITGYATHGPWKEALALYNEMEGARLQPDNFTFPFVLKACAAMLALEEGKRIHDHIVRSGFESDVFVGNSLIAMYAKCRSMEDARQVFDQMPVRDSVSWNGMIVGCTQNGRPDEALELFEQMLVAGARPDLVTMVSALQVCGLLEILEMGRMIHGCIIKNGFGFDSELIVLNSLVTMYAKCGRIDVARQVFDKMSKRTVVSWNSMIAGYAQNGHADKALDVFHQMMVAGVKANSVTVASVLPACAQLGDLQEGKSIHAHIIRCGIDSGVFVVTALVDMYAKCGNVEIARELFDKMSKRNVVSWNAMIAGYAHNGLAYEGMELFHRMQLADEQPNSSTMISVLQACAQLGDLHQGKWIHDCIIQSGFEKDVSVENSLIAMYAKCKNLEAACEIFDRMPQRNTVTWNAMISGYIENGHANEALALFKEMQLENMEANSVTAVSILSACAQLAALQLAKWMHAYILRKGFELNVIVETALIDMYAKSGSIDYARRMFEKASERNVVTWSAMILAYGMHGYGEDAIALFGQMLERGVKPNDITLTCILTACSHTGLVNEGWQYFDSMSRDYHIMPRVEHYSCMVDLLGRAGKLEEAQKLIEKVGAQPDATVLGALLGACRIHCNYKLGEKVAELLFNLEPENVGCYVLMSNIYAAAGKWDDVAKVRATMREKRLKKTPGYSLIEMNNKIHTFLVGDRSHPQSENIYATLETLFGQIQTVGYVPETDFVLHDVEEEVKEHMLCIHSEKLAIAFGLLNTSPGTPICITKNLRVCGDCHSATKFISKIVKREIMVRDANRFHRFKEGFCSCKDYWYFKEERPFIRPRLSTRREP